MKNSVESDDLDALFRSTYQYFRTVFQGRPNADVCKINLLSLDWPEAVLRDRAMTGAAFSGALVAILSHEMRAENLADKFLQPTLSPQLLLQLDEVIIAQGAITGDPLFASDLVLMRVCEWRLKDRPKYQRWQRALDKAFRIDQQRTAAPLDNPFLPDMKRLAVQQLRPVLMRMQERFSKERVLPADKTLNDEIVDAFTEETNNPDLTFMIQPHNRELWIRFWRRNPVTYLRLSPEKLFDEFTGFVSMHEPEYARQQMSRLKIT